MSESDDDVPTLPADTLALVEAFKKEQVSTSCTVLRVLCTISNMILFKKLS